MSDNLESQPKRTPISMTSLDFVADVLAFLCLVLLAWTGLFVFDELRGSINRIFWGIDRHSWFELHERFGVLLLVLLGYHIGRHAQWIRSAFSGRLFLDSVNRTRTWMVLGVAGVGLVILIAATLF